MSEWKVYYRAFSEYKKTVAGDKNIKRFCEALERASADRDSLETTRTYCVIDEDWVEIIETGLKYVEKAMREERQFIQRRGEVKPIEKLKRVSKETARHLAQHSEYIVKMPEQGEPLTPEKLYTSENLSDYAVYENRFLYMLLRYFRDFIRVRLDKIRELSRTFRLHANVEKRLCIGSKRFHYKTELCYEDWNGEYADEFFAAAPIIERIEASWRLVTVLLTTPLMKEVAKAPTLRPPITLTNVLRMNAHFKGALEAYGKLTAYTKDGYELKEIKNRYQPLPEEMMAEQAVLITLQQYLLYKYGNNLEAALCAEYEQEEKRRSEENEKRTRERLETLRAQFAQEEKNQDEYILFLEERLSQQEKDRAELRSAREKIENTGEEMAALSEKIEALKKENEDLRGAVLEKERICDEEVRSAWEKTLQAQAECKKKCDEADEKCEKISQEKIFAQAQLDGLRRRCGLISPQEDFTSKERFLELQEEFAAFEELFQTQWGYTKKRIRREILGRKPKN